jgi:hypothetical protein
VALSDLRTGNLARGLDQLAHARRTPGFGRDPRFQAFAFVVEALCPDGLGRPEPALEALHNAELLLRQRLWERSLPLPADADWQHWLIVEILYREAEARIVHGPIFPVDPFVPSTGEELKRNSRESR